MRRDPKTLNVGHKMVKQAHGIVQQYFTMLPRHQYDGITKQTVVLDKTIAFQFADS